MEERDEKYLASLESLLKESRKLQEAAEKVESMSPPADCLELPQEQRNAIRARPRHLTPPVQGQPALTLY